jgi:hypothetical protein
MRVVLPFQCPVDVIVNTETGKIEDVVIYDNEMSPAEALGNLGLHRNSAKHTVFGWPRPTKCPVALAVQAQATTPTPEQFKAALATVEDYPLSEFPELHYCHD